MPSRFRRRLPLAVLAAVLIVPPCVASAQAAAPPPTGGPAAGADPIRAAAWLAGCWELRRGARTTLEMWMPPDGGMMLGASRTVVGGTVREYELLRLTAREGRLTYTAMPSGQRTTDFTTPAAPADPLVFENLAHDFPQRIVYRRAGADSLIARIEGPGDGGAIRGIDFPMRRIPCAGPSPAPGRD